MLNRIRRISLIGLSLVVPLALLLTPSGGAEALRPGWGPGDLSEGADAIVAGTVISAVGFWNADGTGIYTEVVVSVEQSLKGPSAGSRITVIVPGGRVDGIAQRMSDTPSFTAGDRPTLSLKQLPAEQISERGLAISDVSLPLFELYGLHQAESPSTQDGTDDPYLAAPAEWLTGTLNEGGSESGTLQVESGTLEVEQSGYVYNGMKWFGDWPVVDYKVNAPSSASNTAVQNAGSTWSNAGAEFSFNYAGTHSRTGGYQYNGVNEIMWVNLGSGGPLARAIWWYDPDTGQIVEADMEFNTYYTWSTATPTPSGSFDVETVALHEFGHWLSLGHSDIEEAIMYAYYTGTQRTLHADDIAGIRYIYGAAISYTISGSILDGEGMPLQGVSVAASGGHEQTVLTDEYGAYALTGVQEGAVDINITPTKSGYRFDPVSRIVEGPMEADVSNQDFTAWPVAPVSLETVLYEGTGFSFGSHVGDTLKLTFSAEIVHAPLIEVHFAAANWLYEGWAVMDWDVSGNQLVVTVTKAFGSPRDVVGDRVMIVTGLNDGHGFSAVVPDGGVLVEAAEPPEATVLESVVYAGTSAMFGSHVGDTLTFTFSAEVFHDSLVEVTFAAAARLYEGWTAVDCAVSGNQMVLTAARVFGSPRDVVGDRVMTVTGLIDEVDDPVVVPEGGVEVTLPEPPGPAELLSVVYAGTGSSFGSHVGDTLTFTFSDDIVRESLIEVTFEVAQRLYEGWTAVECAIDGNVLVVTAARVFGTPRDVVGDSVTGVTGLHDVFGFPVVVESAS